MSQIKAYNGSAFISATPKVWNGSSWVEPVTKYWNGSSWVALTNVPLVPQGLIIPLNSSSVPTDWTRFASADGKFIAGAGATYAVGATGGQTQVVVATDTEPDHTGTYTAMLLTPTTGGSQTTYYRSSATLGSAAGAHSHNATINFTPANQQLLLIQADKDLNEFPANGVVLTKANSNPGSLTGVYTSNDYLTSGGSVTANSQVLSVDNITSNGAHIHGGYATISDGNIDPYRVPYPGSVGSHDHNNTINSLTLNADAIKKAYLMAWTKTSAFTDASGVIAMWEGSTAPTGWSLCDGTAGTLDLRDYFIKLSDSTNVGTTSGDNTVDINGTTAADGAHDHRYYSSVLREGNNTQNTYHEQNSDHTHALTGSDSYVPEYYALTFITYAG